jgi:CheY-like chemotaxis protein
MNFDPRRRSPQRGNIEVPKFAPTILLIDDDDAAREFYTFILEDEGFAVRGCESVPEAITELERRPPEVLITDLAMPRVSGFDLINYVRSQPRLSELPIIAITADGDGYRKRAIGLGVSKFLVKPFSNEQLLNTIKDSLSKKTAA